MKSRTFKVILRTTVKDVESLKCRMEVAEQKLLSLAAQVSEHELSSVSEANVVKSVNRTDLAARDNEFLKKVSLIKQTQNIIRAAYEEQKVSRKPFWEKILPRWVSFRNP